MGEKEIQILLASLIKIAEIITWQRREYLQYIQTGTEPENNLLGGLLVYKMI